ncbi:hypothetical protein FW320_20335 [Azospirillum sp. Vi22]|uniref:hypothetical protein n=1 Tax=Azospirillum baldaniorum TaxID=1064539 RepID=UPI00157B83A0|nr:hypothetical protein [Azospirillum baldaniorum]NUB08517.1 hypothetical protein [Azospirillum baldaniorum]
MTRPPKRRPTNPRAAVRDGRRGRIAKVAGLAAAGLLAGCASVGPTDNPVARKLTWVSYLNGDDLRAACTKGESDRYRLVFNADYQKHVRTYDIVGDRGTGGAMVEARVLEATDLARIDLDDPAAVGRGPVVKAQLSPRQFALFVLRLYESGAFEPAPSGVRLPSNGVYWLINGCRRGSWFFNAYPYPSDRFADIRFDGPLKELDGSVQGTGVPYPVLPRPQDAPRTLPTGGQVDSAGVVFEVQVGRDGLVGPTAPFGNWLFAGK